MAMSEVTQFLLDHYLPPLTVVVSPNEVSIDLATNLQFPPTQTLSITLLLTLRPPLLSEPTTIN